MLFRSVLLLLLEERGCSRQVHADIELRERDLNTELRERLEVLGDVGWELADDEVGLYADTVDGDTLGLQALDQVLVRSRLRARALDVVVVDVQLRVGVGRARSAEGDGDVLLSQGVVEDGVTESAVVVERLCAGESVQVQRTGNTE